MRTGALKVNAAELRKQGFRPYRKTTVTYAKQIANNFAVRLDTGDVIYGKAGDFACVSPDDGSRWVVERGIFNNMYTDIPVDKSRVRPGATEYRLLLQGFRPYHKHQVTWAKRISQPMIVHTLEGDVRAEEGDYLCIGQNGEQWPQPAKRFEKHYVRIEGV
jgi:hypothetical protein